MLTSGVVSAEHSVQPEMMQSSMLQSAGSHVAQPPALLNEGGIPLKNTEKLGIQDGQIFVQQFKVMVNKEYIHLHTLTEH